MKVNHTWVNPTRPRHGKGLVTLLTNPKGAEGFRTCKILIGSGSGQPKPEPDPLRSVDPLAIALKIRPQVDLL